MAITPPITDWDDAYANGAYIAEAESYPECWARAAQAFREQLQAAQRARLGVAYGEHPREHYDLFLPSTDIKTARGIVVFVHGGYWMRFDQSSWSQLAAGACAAGWQVVLPGYTLCPELRIADIGRQIASAIAHVAADNRLPLRLAGHSAGGQLVSRMVCQKSPLPAELQQRIDRVLSISGVHDLRPLLRTSMNDTLQLSETEAIEESPALHRALETVALYCYAGAAERPEFRRQNRLLANIWQGSGLATTCQEVEGRHHFDVIDELETADSAMTRSLTE